MSIRNLSRQWNLRAWSAAAAILAVALAPAGCVQRRLTIRSNPPGALVYVDDQEVGVTPVSTNFTYYGTRKIRLVKDGYETLTVMQPVGPAWYQIPPLDFVTENMVPGELRDQRQFSYQMMPQLVVPTDQLVARAEEMRRGAPQPPVAAAVAGPVGQATVGPPLMGPPAAAVPAPTMPATTIPPGVVQPPAAVVPETVPAPAGTPPAGVAPTVQPPWNAVPPPAMPYGGQPTYPLPPGAGR